MKLLCTLLFLTGCSFFIGGKEPPKTAKGSLYSITFSQPYWVNKKEKRSDYIFENSRDGRILLSNSFCNEFQEQPLEQLAKKTFTSIEEFETVSSEYTTFHNRVAYRVEGHGKVDGVKVNLRLLNTRRDNCYFDFLSITPGNGKNQHTTFDEFLKTVVFK